MRNLNDSLIGEFLGHEFQLGIPIFAEAADERFFQELIDREVLFLSFEDGHLAYVPTVVVEGTVGAVLAYANGIEVARDGLIEGDATLTIGALDGAVAAATLVVAGEDTVLAVHDGGDEFATGVMV